MLSLMYTKLKDYLQISLLILSQFEQINELLFPLKSSDNRRFSDDFGRNWTSLIRLNSINVRSTFEDDP